MEEVRCADGSTALVGTIPELGYGLFRRDLCTPCQRPADAPASDALLAANAASIASAARPPDPPDPEAEEMRVARERRASRRERYFASRGMPPDSPSDCENCLGPDGEVDEFDRDGCAVCDGTGHVSMGKGGGYTTLSRSTPFDDEP